MKLVRIAISTLGVLLMTSTLAHAMIKLGDKIEPFKLPDLEGKETQLAFDKKVNVLSFWVSTCSLCKEELKTINELQGVYKDVGFNVVSTDFGGARIVKWVLNETKTETKVPILIDTQSEIATKKYGIVRFPTLVIMDKDGVIKWYNDGWEADSATRIKAEIEFLLKQ